MSLPVVWSDEAKAEFYDSEQCYAEISVHLAARFVEAVENSVQLIRIIRCAFPLSTGSEGVQECGAFPMAFITRLKLTAYC